MVVYKYPLPLQDRPTLLLPDGATVLSCQMQGRCLQVWALVDPDAPPTRRRFRVAGTGHELDAAELAGSAFLGTVQRDGLMWHVWELAP